MRKTISEFERNIILTRMREKKITRLQLARELDVPYSTLNPYLNGFLPMPDIIRARCYVILGIEPEKDLIQIKL